MSNGESIKDSAEGAGKRAALEAGIMRLIKRSRRTQKMLSYADLAAELGESETEIRTACGNLKRKGLITG